MLAIDAAKQNLQTIITNLIKKPVDLNFIRMQDHLIRVQSNELIHQLGIPMFKSLIIGNFSKVNRGDDGNYWFDMTYQYDHLAPGSNGTPCVSVIMNPEGSVLSIKPAGVREAYLPGDPEFKRLMIDEARSEAIFELVKKRYADNDQHFLSDKSNPLVELPAQFDSYIDIEFWLRSENTVDSDTDTDVAAKTRITIDTEGAFIYAVSTLNSEEHGDECKSLVTRDLINELQQVVEPEAHAICNFLSKNGFNLSVKDPLVEWTDSPNIEPEDEPTLR